MKHQLSKVRLEIPDGAFECPLGFYWFDDNGLMIFVMQDAAMNMKTLKESAEQIKLAVGNTPVNLLLEISKVKPLDTEAMNYAASVLPPLIKSMAVISKSSLATLTANVFFHFKPVPFPAKMFIDEKKAYKWLEQYF